MFLPLAETELVRHYCVIVVDLPGFGDEPPFEDRFATPSCLAQAVADIASVQRTEIVVAHSVGSVIASMAAMGPRSGIRTVISLEGNLTAADCSFTSLLEEYEHPEREPRIGLRWTPPI